MLCFLHLDKNEYDRNITNRRDNVDAVFIICVQHHLPVHDKLPEVLG